MGYKRTSKKTGATTRRTKTYNTNGSETNSWSEGTKNFRTTYSNNSKTGNKVTQTYRDGAGFTHTRTLYKSPTEASRRREAKQNQKFWASIFGGKKKKPKQEKATLSSWVALGILILFGILYLKSA